MVTKKFPTPKIKETKHQTTITFPTTTVSGPEGVVTPPTTDLVRHRHGAKEIQGTPTVVPTDFDTEEMAYIFKTTLRQQHRDNPTVMAFIREYVQSRDLREAASEVGISVKDARLLRSRKDIFECITRVTERAVLKYGIDPEEVVKKVWDVADVDPASMIDERTGATKAIHDIPIETRRAIKKMVIKELWDVDINGVREKIGEVVTVEFWDKLKASELVGREFNKFTETTVVEHGPTKDMKEILLQSEDRARLAIEAIDVTGSVDEE